jgi:hypothetical protein
VLTNSRLSICSRNNHIGQLDVVNTRDLVYNYAVNEMIARR